MIELPEAVTLSRQIAASLTGRTVTSVIAARSPHKFAWYTYDPALYPALLTGKTVTGTSAYGGEVEVSIGDQSLALSVNMRLYAPGDKFPDKHQLLVAFDDGSNLVCTVQMWGGMFCVPAGSVPGMIDSRLAREKPSPLSGDFTREYFDTLFNEDTPSLTAKSFLATEQRIPGLGNGVLQDILWTARIHPRRKMATLSPSEVDAVFSAVRSVLADMTRLGGRDTEKDLHGNPGGYTTILSKKTVGQPCPACASMILKEAFMGGSVYICPTCQPL